jgi:hypothetical protein
MIGDNVELSEDTLFRELGRENNRSGKIYTHDEVEECLDMLVQSERIMRSEGYIYSLL